MKHSDLSQFEIPRHQRLFEFIRQENQALQAAGHHRDEEPRPETLDALQQAALQSWAPQP